MIMQSPDHFIYRDVERGTMYPMIHILAAAGALYGVWQYQELKKFRVTEYVTKSHKIQTEIKLAVIADLHSFSYGKDNERLLTQVRMAQPDLILVPGDLIVRTHPDKYRISARFAKRLMKTAPVIYSNGNHESRAQLPETKGCGAYKNYYRRLRRAGIIFLNNESLTLSLQKNRIVVSGLELPLSCYKKGRKTHLNPGLLEESLGAASTENLQLLLAHNPEFARQYADWGADITLCGHNHGGLVNLPGIGSVISSQLTLFPEYDAGEFTINKRKVYVSRGLGTHTFHVRVFNRAELVIVRILPEGQ